MTARPPRKVPDDDPSPDGEDPDSPARTTAAGDLLAEAFPHLSPDVVARCLGLDITPTKPSRPTSTRKEGKTR